MTSEVDKDLAHKEKMLRRDKVYEERQAQATREKGLLIVHTGAGKGGTSWVFAVATRCSDKLCAIRSRSNPA